MKRMLVEPFVARRGRRVASPLSGGLLLALLLLALLLLGGCGFQLRGTLEIPADYSPIFVESGGQVGEAMQQRLAAGGLAVTQAPAQAGLILRVLEQGRNSRILAVDRDGKALAYELTYFARFDALARDGRVVLAPQGVSAMRSFDDNPDVAVLGKQLESEIIYQDLVADLADRILLRLRAALSANGPGQPAGQ
jgi:LPS-assembly lipoprotein